MLIKESVAYGLWGELSSMQDCVLKMQVEHVAIQKNDSKMAKMAVNSLRKSKLTLPDTSTKV